MRNLLGCVSCLLQAFVFIIGSGDLSLIRAETYSYTECGNMFSCGKYVDIGYPFWGGDRPKDCGRPGFELVCKSDGKTYITIELIEYLVVEIFVANQTLKIARTDYLQDVCPEPADIHNNHKYVNTTLDHNTFNFSLADVNLTLMYNCPQVREVGQFSNPFNCSDERGYANLTSKVNNTFRDSCFTNVVVQVLPWVIDLFSSKGGVDVFREALKSGFEIVWMLEFQEMCRNCELSYGRCGYDLTPGFICLCVDGSYSYNLTCSGQNLPSPSEPKERLDVRRKVIIAFSVCAGTILIMLAIFFLYQRRKKSNYAPSSYFTRNVSSDPSSAMNDPEKMGALYGVKFFTYDELEEATDSFNDKREIGDGGFGTVYLGKLKDGRTVAVKRLYENNYKRVEQFLNEVEILTRLRHKNLVMLYGCTSRHSRELLLVYEYASNGTVADHIHGCNAKLGSLPWDTRLKIAVETASALKYLHASDIIHRDVKTNNILLDDNFSVKVADFGLSRLFPLDVTHVSTAPQGTPGYVDPEYHQCYQLTDKSDVYSFGVVLVELISSKPAVDITRHRHEINLSNLAINKIQTGSLPELVDPSLGFEKDRNVHKSVTAVAELAFQCLQSDKDLRPTMQEVLEILTRIQCGNCDMDKGEDLDVLSDEFVLLKSGPLPVSPDSVTVKWVSGSVASNSSV